ncbi:MAG: ABC transporter permease [Ignavibacteria bacterium]|jgi:lipoprotein-releasing system permease protein
MIEFFIAKRYLKSKHKINFISIISIISTIGIALGVASLIVVLSVFNGFGSLVSSILISFDPHLRISSYESNSTDNLLYDKIKTNDEIESLNAFLEGQVILLNGKTYEVQTLKGIESKGNLNWGLQDKIISGEFDLTNEGDINKIILGLPTALRLSARVGDTIVATSFRNIEQSLFNFSLPRSLRFVVTGLFETNNKSYDNKQVFTSLESSQILLGLKDKISGCDIRLKNIENTNRIKEDFISMLGEDYKVESWFDLHKDLYTVMLIERWAAYIILCLIIIVAAFNILGSLSMTVIEKRKDIGILRSIGLPGKSIKKIFMFEGILVGVVGTSIGLLLGLVICVLQIKYNLYPLDPTKYIINSMPVEIRFPDLIAICGMSLLLSFLAGLYPASKAAKQNIVEAIKWE